MKKSCLLISLFVILGCAETYAQVSFGVSELINSGWKFTGGDIIAATSKAYDDSSWSDVDLPHDWSVAGEYSEDNPSCMGYLPAGTGMYRKEIFIGEESEGKRLFLYFEGIYNRSTVWVNGHCLGTRPSGYVSFMYDITPYLDYGQDNIIAVRVDHSRTADSRWYTGSGIYRNVWLIESGQLHISQWGVYAVPEYDRTSGKWTLDVQVGLRNDSDADADMVILNEVMSPEGVVIARDKGRTAVGQGEEVNYDTRLRIRNPELWDLDSPVLYCLKTSVYKGRTLLDKTETKVGFRYFSFDPDKGFFMNGENKKIKGVCIHHDAGVLGAAVPEPVLRARLETLKDIGCNAIRTTHNPMSPDFYNLCDELGLLVLNEAFDEWEYPKRKWIDGWNIGEPGYDGSYDFFEEWGERDLSDMVKRDRNHPCIFAWSIGNEVDYPNDPYSHPVLDGKDSSGFSQPIFGGYDPEAPRAERLGVIAKRLAGIVRSLDPSRPVTAGLAGVAMSNQTGYPDALDITGYNYTESRYQSDHIAFPDRVIFGSENRHDYEAWKAVRDNRHISGQFIWTGIDYLGESNAWPSRGFGSGLIDLAGNMKSLGWYRKSLWTDEPFVHIGTFAGNADPLSGTTDSWNYTPGETVSVVCYTNCRSAVLYLNGEQVGEALEYDDSRGYLIWRIPFVPGRLEVFGQDAAGDRIASHYLQTSGKPVGFKVEKSVYDDLVILSVEIVDAEGVRVPVSGIVVDIQVAGDAMLLGVESGDNTDMDVFDGRHRKSYKGRVTAYIRYTGEDKAVVTLSAAGVRMESVLL